MVKELTNEGIKEEDLDLPPRRKIENVEPKKVFKKEETEEPEIKQKVSSYDPKKPMKTLSKILIISGISIFLLALIGLLFWYNISVNNGKLSPTVNNNVDTPDVTAQVGVNATNNNQYNITIENKIYLAENMSKEIANEIINTIKNCSSMNWTNCTI